MSPSPPTTTHETAPAEKLASTSTSTSAFTEQTAPADKSTAASSVRYLPTGISVLALRRWPWERSNSLGLRLASAETIVCTPTDGGHHLENRFTAFYHSYFMPRRWGIDMRSLELSAFARTGVMNRADAAEVLNSDRACDPQLLALGKKRLGFDDEGFDAVMTLPKHSYRDYTTYKRRFELMKPPWRALYKADRVRPQELLCEVRRRAWLSGLRQLSAPLPSLRSTCSWQRPPAPSPCWASRSTCGWSQRRTTVTARQI
jgi:hypothetical protein